MLDLDVRFLAKVLNTTAIIIYNRGIRQSAGARPELVSGGPYVKLAQSAKVFSLSLVPSFASSPPHKRRPICLQKQPV